MTTNSLPSRWLAAAAIVSLQLTAWPSQKGAGHDDTPEAEDITTDAPFELVELETPAGPGSFLPNLVLGADSVPYLSWAEHGAGDSASLRMTHFDGAKWAPPKSIVEAENLLLNWADFPSLCVSPEGVLIAQWLETDEAQHAYFAKFSISKDRGTSWSEPKRLHDDDSPTEHGFVSIAAWDESRFVAIWLDGRGMVDVPEDQREMRLYSRSISIDGRLGPESIVDPRVCDCCQTHLIRTAQDRLVAAYRDRDEKEVRDISIASFDGESWSAPSTVHDDGWMMPGCPVNGPALAVHGTSLNALWFTGAGEGGGQVLFAKRRSSATSFGFPTRIDGGSTMGRVDLVAGPHSLFASWLEHEEGSQANWKLQRIGEMGPVGEAMDIGRVSSNRGSGFMRLAPIADGCLMAWTSASTPMTIRSSLLRRVPE